MKNFFQRMRSAGLKNELFYCPICKNTSAFLPAGVVPRPNAKCPHCSSYERHRLLWLYLHQETGFFFDRLRVLDIAPHAYLQERFRAMKNLDYLSTDLSSPLAMQKMDLTNLQLPDDSFDCVMCYHVLEHIPDDRRALHEIRRVLRPGGFAILQSPVDYDRAETYEDFSITDPADREKHFHQWDHVRVYGRDYPKRLEHAGFQVTVRAFAEELGPVMLRRCALRQNERLHLCRKPA